MSAEADALTALALRSKAHWGYDAEFMAAARHEMELRPQEVGEHETWLLEDVGGTLIGFYRLVPVEPAILEDLWIDPGMIGNGHGRQLWDHALATARGLGAKALELDADPNAVGFYGRMGARVIGETPSAVVAGRHLPRMRVELS